MSDYILDLTGAIAIESPTLGGSGTLPNYFFVDVSTLTAEQLALLKGATGAQGIQGVQGPQGVQGDTGLSAYDVAVANGFEGTEEEFYAIFNAINTAGFDAVATDLLGTDTIGTVATNITNIGIVAAIVAHVQAVSTIATEVSKVASIRQYVVITGQNSLKIQSVADNISDVQKLALIDDAISAVALNEENITGVHQNKTNIDIVAGDKTNIDIVAGDKANIDAVAGNKTNIDKVATNETNINKVAQIDDDVTEVASIKTDVQAVSGSKTSVETVGTDLALGESGKMAQVIANKTNIDAVAGNETNINAVNANKDNIDAVAGNKTNIDLVAGAKDNIDALASDIANPAGSIPTVNANLENVETVADDIEKVNAVGADLALGESSNIRKVSSSKAAIDDLGPIKNAISALALIVDEITAVDGVKTDVTALAAKLTELQGVYAKLVEIEALYGKTSEIDALYAEIANIGEKATVASVDALAGTGRTTETVKGNADAIATLETTVDTNRLYSDSQYLELKAKADTLQVALNSAKAELYTDDPILQYGAVEIIGDGYKADGTSIDVSANVVDGKLSMEQKGLTITNLVKNGDFSQGTTGWILWRASNSVSSNGMVKWNPSIDSNSSSYNQEISNLVIGDVYVLLFWRYLSRQTRFDVSMYDPGGFTNDVMLKTSTELAGTLFNIIKFICAKSSARFSFANYNPLTTDTVGIGNVRLINLTALGLDHITDTDILAKLLPYVDGTKAVGKMGVRVVGKNRVNIESKNIVVATATLSPTDATTKAQRANYDIVVGMSGDGYTRAGSSLASADTKTGTVNFTSGFNGYGIGFRCKANAGDVVARNSSLPANVTGAILFCSLDGTALSFTTTATGTAPAGTAYAFLVFSAVAGSYSVVGAQLESGSTATTYEPYQEQLTFLTTIGNSLPNGVADSVKTVADGWERTQRVRERTLISTDVTSMYTALTNLDWAVIQMPSDCETIIVSEPRTVILEYPWVVGATDEANNLTSNIGRLTAYDTVNKRVSVGFAKGTSLADARTALAGKILYYQLATPITTHYDLPHLTSGKTIYRFAGEEKIALYGTGLTFSENVLTVLSAIKFVAGEMTDITDLATITGDTVTFSGVNATDVVYVKVEHDVDRPLGVLEHTPTVSNTASRLAALEAVVFGG